MVNLYCTADKVGIGTGGGLATYHEYRAMCGLGETILLDGNTIQYFDNPFLMDQHAESLVSDILQTKQVKRAHFYSGTFTNTVRTLRKHGVKITYTVAAHDRHESMAEFKNLGMNYPHTHIADDTIYNVYSAGYREADLVICPSVHSADIMRKAGCSQVMVIPHGTDIPYDIKSLPKIFTVGYLGQSGPDKGLVYLFQAWKSLQYKNDILLLAGRTVMDALPLVRACGGGNVRMIGFVESPSDLYNACSVYVQPSVTEGFGIEILEAMAHNRVVIASTGAGGSFVIDDNVNGLKFSPRNINELAAKIDWCRSNLESVVAMGERARDKSKKYSWDIVRSAYQMVWGTL